MTEASRLASRLVRRLCLGAALGIVGAVAAVPAVADVKAGVDAWSAGDYDAAVKEWKRLADQGDPDAQFNLAQAYKLGRGVPLDLTRAEQLYGQAAARGHVQAADTYGLLLFQRGEREKALPYVQASAARGDPRAQYILGVAYFNGDLVAKDWVRAYALVSLARQAGLPQATGALAQMDAHIPLAERQKSVILSTQIAAEAQATRARQSASADLGAAAIPPAPQQVAMATPSPARFAPPELNPAPAGTDYIHAAPPIVAAKPLPAPLTKPAASTKAPPAMKPATTPTARVPAPATLAATKPAAAPPKPAPAPAAAGAWRVQLGAFGVAGNADALWAKLKSRPELAGHGKLLVPAGSLKKLQAGGFASQAAAEAACAKLKAGGFTCLPVRD